MIDFLKKVFDVNSRAGRQEFIIGVSLLYFAILFILRCFGAILGYMHVDGVVSIVFVFIMILCFIGVLSLKIRRLHDLGYSGWLVLCQVIPIINLILFLMFIFKKGEAIENEYGKPIGSVDPK